MSLPALNHVLYTTGPGRVLRVVDGQATAEVDPWAWVILVYVSDQAGKDGTGAIVSVRDLVEWTGASDSTVKRKLRDLRAQGLIVPGDAQLVAHLPMNRRPAVWDLPGVRGVRVTPRKRRQGGQDDPPKRAGSGGSLGGHWGVTGGSLETPTPNTPTAPTSPAAAGGLHPPAGGRGPDADELREMRAQAKAARARSAR